MIEHYIPWCMNESPTKGNPKYSCPAALDPIKKSKLDRWIPRFLPGQCVIAPQLGSRLKTQEVNEEVRFICHNRFRPTIGWVIDGKNKVHAVGMHQIQRDITKEDSIDEKFHFEFPDVKLQLDPRSSPDDLRGKLPRTEDDRVDVAQESDNKKRYSDQLHREKKFEVEKIIGGS